MKKCKMKHTHKKEKVNKNEKVKNEKWKVKCEK